MTTKNRSVREFLPGLWRSSEHDAKRMIYKTPKRPFRCCICLRRKTPDWWEFVRRMSPDLELLHFPVRPSKDRIQCKEDLLGLLYVLAGLPKPLLLFCKEGRNRTGMLAAVLCYADGQSEQDAIGEYLTLADVIPRVEELLLIQGLCQELKTEPKDNNTDHTNRIKGYWTTSVGGD